MMVDKDFIKSVAADIYLLLPGRNCGVTQPPSPCGLKKCAFFAKELVKGTRTVYDCPYMEDEDRQSILLLLEDYFK
jgi:CO dehydrogenase/acetyl-CoA synthase gamma subunit (corrinoid Fe-S protein)